MKKGFTLVELLAIIIILGIIAVITVPIINRTIVNAKDKLYEEQVSQIQSAAKKWGSSEIDILNSAPGNVYFLSISELQDSGYLESSDILDPRNKEKMDGCIVVKYDNEYNQYTYKYNINTCEVAKTNIVYDNGTAIYFNPETGKICNDYKDDNSLNKNKTGCMKWYIFNDSSNTTTVNMILDHNTQYYTIWNSSGTKGPGTSSNNILGILKEDTKDWTGVKDRTDTYTLSTYSVDYTGYKARLITANEVAKITSTNWNENTSVSGYYLAGARLLKDNPYYWLYDYTFDCEATGCKYSDSQTYGYFTATILSNNDTEAWRVGRNGNTGTATILSRSYGIRPVITIDKETIN